jgi:hypothetical protein
VEVLPPEHRGLRVSPIFQRSDLAGRGLERFEEGERVDINPSTDFCRHKPSSYRVVVWIFQCQNHSPNPTKSEATLFQA